MTPKERAIDIVDKFQCDSRYDQLPTEIAKIQAQKAVDEIIKSREEDGSFDDTLSSTSSEYYTPHPMYLTYWNLVKKEIEKL